MPSYGKSTLLSLLALGLLSACEDSGGKARPDDTSLDAGPDAGEDAAAASEDAGVDGGGEDAGRDAGTGDASEAEDEQQVSLTFKAQFGAQPFACGTQVDDVGTTGVSVFPRDLRVFLQDIALIRAEDKAEVPLVLDVREPFQAHGAVLLDFEDAQADCGGAGNAQTNVVVTGKVPRGEYRGLVFSQGVPVEVNHQNPIDLSPPLSEGPMHWGWQGGFLFLRAELKADATSSTVHLGSTACSGSPSAGYGCDKSNRSRVSLPDFDAATHSVVFDVAELFSQTDLTKITVCHGMGASCAPFFDALGLSLDDGSADAALQRVYRAE